MKPLFASAIALLVLGIAVALYAKPEPWRGLSSRSEFVLTGNFVPGGAGNATSWGDPRNQARSTFGTGPGGAGRGSFRTGTFSAPALLRCYLAGFPRSPGIRIFLKDAATGGELALGSTMNPWYAWQERIWTIPTEWRGRTVEFQVEDRADDPTFGWVAVTEPEATNSTLVASLGRALYRSVFLVLELVWFLIPGIALALALPRGGVLLFATTVVVAAAGLGYALFWIYLQQPKTGAIASGLLFSVSAATIWRLRRPVERELRMLLAAVLLTAVFYNALGYLYYTDDSPGEVAQTRFTLESMPPDNMLQYLFAWATYYSKPVRPYLIATVHASDRPPLETALSLEQWPFWRMLTTLYSYQLLGVGLQCLWVAGLWILLRAGGISPPVLASVLLFIVFSGFAWENSFYIWPKLLAAAFCLMGMAAIPAFRQGSEPWTHRATLTASAAFGFSLLSHSGSGFTILAVLIYLTVRRRLPPWRMALPALGLAAILFAPWRAYQVLIDPPGNTLLKLHLAGVTDEHVGLAAALTKGYGALSAGQIVSAKLRNFQALFVPTVWRAGTDIGTALRNLVDLSFFAFFPCAGLLNFGWLARLRLDSKSAEVRCADRLLLVALATLPIWCLLLFEPGSTVVHQGSFAAVLLYFAAMAMYLRLWSWRGMLALTALQAMVVFPVHVLLAPLLTRTGKTIWNGGIDPGMAMAAGFSLAILVSSAILLNSRKEPPHVNSRGADV